MSLIPQLVQSARDSIAKSLEDIRLFQSVCVHPADKVTKKPNNDADDYDAPGKGAHHWYDCTCGDCGKHWEERQ